MFLRNIRGKGFFRDGYSVDLNDFIKYVIEKDGNVVSGGFENHLDNEI